MLGDQLTPTPETSMIDIKGEKRSSIKTKRGENLDKTAGDKEPGNLKSNVTS